MTFSDFISDSLADQEVFLSTHITCLLFSSLLHFLDLSFPNKIVLFSPKLKKKNKSYLFPFFPLSKIMLSAIAARSLMLWFQLPFSAADLSEPFSSPCHSIRVTVSITILTYICLRLKISALSLPSMLVSCP